MKRLLAAAVALLVFAGCNGVANPFMRTKPRTDAVPMESVKSVAAGIEQAVAGGNRDYAPEGAGGVVVDAPEIKQAVRMRAARSELVREILDAGWAHEERGGLLALRPTREYREATTRRQRDRHAMVVLNENENRWQLYEGIVKASGMRPNTLSAVQLAFFEARLALMGPGQPYEDESGNIVKKSESAVTQ